MSSNSFRSSPERPVWSEGLLLSPQHLQAADRYHEARLDARAEALTPFSWGLLELEIDAGALAAGQVRLNRFAGVLPDGSPVAFETADQGPRARDVGDRFPPTAQALEVWLALPRERSGVPAYGPPEPASPSRFATAGRPMQDATAPAEALEVQLARPNLQLLLGSEPREDHDALKIAELVHAPAGGLALSDRFVPACLRLAASPWLLAGVRDLLARAVAKGRELVETRRHREAASELTGPDVVRLLQLLVVNGSIPVLAHLADPGDASPREGYLALLQLAAQAGTFHSADPSALPRFKHDDLRATFEPLFGRLGELLGGMAAQRYVTIPLEKRAGGLHAARLADERLLHADLFLAVKSELAEAVVTEQLPRLCKIACAADIQALIQAAATGVTVQVVHRPPPELPVQPDRVYFSLGQGDRFWQGIVAARNMALFLPPPFDPERTLLELLAIPREPPRVARLAGDAKDRR